MMLLANLEPLRWIFLAAAFAAVLWVIARTQRQLRRTRTQWPELPDRAHAPGRRAYAAAASSLDASSRSATAAAYANTPPGASLSPTLNDARQLLRERNEICQAEIQFHELARSLMAQIDSKAALLASLLREARSEAARLERLLEAARGSRATTQAAALTSATSSGAVPAGNSRAPSPSGNVGAGGAGAASGFMLHDAAHPAPPAPSTGNRPVAEIYRLADLGLTPAQIAERTACPEGEVELILGLRRHAAS